MSKYEPLGKYLADTKQDRVEIGFPNIESILGFELPESAQCRPEWWYGSAEKSPTHVWKKAWQEYGYVVEHVDFRFNMVWFIKESLKPRKEKQNSTIMQGEFDTMSMEMKSMGIDYKGAPTKEKINIVLIYYARMQSSDVKYKTDMTRHLKILAARYNRKFSTLRQNKDVYDAQFENGRKGWHQRNIAELPYLHIDYEKYKDTPMHELEEAVEYIMAECNTQQYSFYTLKSTMPDEVNAVLGKKNPITISKLSWYLNEVKIGDYILLVFGGDNPKWETGLKAIAKIVKAPYNIDGKHYSIDIEILLQLDRPIRQNQMVTYPLSYDVPSIGPATKGIPNQAIKSLDEIAAVTIIRAMLDIQPDIISGLKTIFDQAFIDRIKGSVPRLFEAELEYGETEPELIEQEEEREDEVPEDEPTPYTKDDFLADMYIDEAKYETLKNRLKIKKNIIIQGAPGVGKSFIAKKFAYSLLGFIKEKNVAMIQFHQNYSYEDFVMGYRPDGDGSFRLQTGVFFDICERARKSREPHYLIIDEINRGNLSRIFGELLLLAEADKRGKEYAIPLLYQPDRAFSVPDNLYIIGLMNTADRSLAMMDYALRRRFSFIPIEPQFESPKFMAYVGTCQEKDFLIKVIEAVLAVNSEIGKDDTLGNGFKIGHSYFCRLENASVEQIKEIVLCEIIPLVEEYWADNDKKREQVREQLERIIE